jgi:hypothetical protein
MAPRNPTQRPAPTYSGPTPVYGDTKPLDRADLRVRANRAFGIADVFHRISDVAMQKFGEEQVAKAQVEGAKAGGLDTKTITVMRGGKPTDVKIPTFKPMEGSGAIAKAWNQAAETAYAMRLDTATMEHISAAALENPANPEGLRQSLQGFKDGIKDTIPPEYLAKYEHDLFAMAQPLITKAEKDLMQNIANDQAIDAAHAADTLVGSMVINSSLGAEGGIVSAGQFNNFVDATMKRVGPFFSEAEARDVIRDVLARSAHGSLQAQFEGAGDKRAMYEAFQSGKPVVSIPGIGEDGEVHAAVYDKNSLIQLIGAEKVQTMVNGLAVDIRMQEAEARAAAAEARAQENERLYTLQTDVQLAYPDAVAELEATGSTNTLTAAALAEAYPREKDRKTREKLMAKLGLAAQTGSIRKVMATQPLSEDGAYLESLKPKAGDSDFAERTALYNVAVGEAVAKQKALESDPASYVMQTNPTVQQAWEAAGDGKDAAKVQQAVAATKQAQIELGVPPEKAQSMTSAQASGLASTLNTASPDTIAQTVDAISQTHGPDGLNQVIGAGASPTVKAVAFADAPELGAWRGAAIEASKVKESVLREQMKARNVSSEDMDRALAGITVPLQDTLPAGVAQPYLDAVRQVAMFKVANDGMDVNAAADFAWSAFSSSYSFNGTYRVPKKWDGDKVSNGLRTIISRLDGYDIRPAIMGQGGPIDPAFAKAETIASLKAGNYRWVTDSKETGVILTYEEGNPVMLSDGEPLRIPFDALMVLPSAPHKGVDTDLNKGGVQN